MPNQIFDVDFNNVKEDDRFFLVVFKNGDNPVFTKSTNHTWITEDCLVFAISVDKVYTVRKSLELVEKI